MKLENIMTNCIHKHFNFLWKNGCLRRIKNALLIQMKYINSNVVPDQNFKNRNGKGCVDFNVRRNSPDAFVNTGKKNLVYI